MKRIWFAITFIVLSLIMCVGEQIYIEDVYKDFSSMLSKAEYYLENGKKNELSTEVESIKRYWKKHNNILFSVSDHATLNDFGQSIMSLNVKERDIGAEIAVAKANLVVFRENARITPSNIF